MNVDRVVHCGKATDPAEEVDHHEGHEEHEATRAKLSAASNRSTTEWTEDTEEDIHFRVFRVFRGPPVELHVPITFQEALAPEALAHVRPNRSS